VSKWVILIIRNLVPTGHIVRALGFIDSRMRHILTLFTFFYTSTTIFGQSVIEIEMYWGHDRFWPKEGTIYMDSIDYIHAFLRHPNKDVQFYTQQKGNTIIINHDRQSLDGYTLHILGVGIQEIVIQPVPLKPITKIITPIFQDFRYISCPDPPFNKSAIRAEQRWKNFVRRKVKSKPSIVVDGKPFILFWDAKEKYSLTSYID